jgi:hypothetical protein
VRSGSRRTRSGLRSSGSRLVWGCTRASRGVAAGQRISSLQPIARSTAATSRLPTCACCPCHRAEARAGAVVRWRSDRSCCLAKHDWYCCRAWADRSGLLSYGVFPRIQRFLATTGSFSTGGTLEFPLLAPAVQRQLWKSSLLLTAGSGEFWPAQEEQQAARKAAQDSLLTARHGLVGLGLLL